MAIIAGISGFAGLLILLFGVSRIRLVSLVIKCFSLCDKVKTTMSLYCKTKIISKCAEHSTIDIAVLDLAQQPGLTSMT